MRVLHDSVRCLGMVCGQELPGVPAVGQPGAGGTSVGLHRHSAARFLFICDSHEHCCAHIFVRLSRGKLAENDNSISIIIVFIYFIIIMSVRFTNNNLILFHLISR